MFKTAIFIIAGAVLALALLFGHQASSYARTGVRNLHQAAQDAVPVAFEIERLQTLVGDLDSVIEKQRRKIVRQQVDLDHLEQAVDRAGEQAQDLKEEVAAARRLLAEEKAEYRLADRIFSRQRVIDEATRKAEALKRIRAIHQAKAEALETLSLAVGRADHQIQAAESQRESYRLRLAELRAQAESVAIRQELVHQVEHLPPHIDQGAFQDVEESFSRIERELEVQERALARVQQPSPTELSFTAKPRRNVLGLLDEALKDDKHEVE
jgi:chromosome segregation ATPase